MFTSLGVGSLAGAVFILEPARKRLNSNQMTILGGAALGLVYAFMAVIRDPLKFFIVAGLAGAAWTISASELWAAGQRVMPDWIRGRMNATHMMVSQGGMALAGLLWGVLATGFGLEWALFSASALGFASALPATRWSIDFATRINVEPEPLTVEYYSPYLPEADDGPITATMEIEVAPENHIRFFRLMKEIRLIYLRNGAFSARLDQDFENPIRFRLQAMFISWAALQRLDQRITRDEHALWSELWTLHRGQETPRPKRYLGIQIPEESAMSRLKPVSKLPTPDKGAWGLALRVNNSSPQGAPSTFRVFKSCERFHCAKRPHVGRRTFSIADVVSCAHKVLLKPEKLEA